MERIKRFFKEEEGVTAIEYGLIAAGIGVVIIAAVWAIGDSLNGIFGTVSGKLDGAAAS